MFRNNEEHLCLFVDVRYLICHHPVFCCCFLGVYRNTLAVRHSSLIPFAHAVTIPFVGLLVAESGAINCKTLNKQVKHLLSHDLST